MEKLELKHLAPYLPYGLKMCERIKRINEKTLEEYEMSYGQGEIFSYIGSTTPYIIWDNGRNGTQKTFLSSFTSDKAYKLLLRPLSDLTKEIEHNERTFVPYESKILVDFMTITEEMDCLYESSHDISKDYQMPYYIIEQLIAWHFDVFGLLYAGLAIKK